VHISVFVDGNLSGLETRRE